MTDSQQLMITRESISPVIYDEHPDFFKSVRIYGSYEEPLFVANDVQQYLGFKDMHFEKNYTMGKDRLRMRINTPGGRQMTTLLTERGFYKALSNSRSEIGELFLDYVHVVLRELRINKVVTMESSMKALQEQMNQLTLKNKLLEDELKERYHKMKELESEKTDYECKYKIYKDEFHWMQNEVMRTKRMSENSRDITYVEKLQQRCMKQMYMKMVNPPRGAVRKEMGDTSDTWVPLEAPQVYEDGLDAIDVNDDDEVVFQVTTTEPGGDRSLGGFMVFKEVTLDKLYNALQNHWFHIRLRDGTQKSNLYIGTRQQFLEAVEQVL